MSTLTPWSSAKNMQRTPALPAAGALKTGHADVKFGGLAPHVSPVQARQWVEHLDFTSLGTSPVKQIGLIFSSLITWRLLAANERRRASVSKRWNELRENLMRDLLSFAFWFLGVPVLQRLYLRTVAKRNPQLQNILIQRSQAQATNGKGALHWLKSNNPIHNWYIPSSQQVKDQMHQALQTLSKAGVKPEADVYRQTEATYLNLIKHRNLATALGLGSTILLLGVGINLLNFYLTQKNIIQNQQGPQPFPPATLPTMPKALVPQPLFSQQFSGQSATPLTPRPALAFSAQALTGTFVPPVNPFLRR